MFVCPKHFFWGGGAGSQKDTQTVTHVFSLSSLKQAFVNITAVVLHDTQHQSRCEVVYEGRMAGRTVFAHLRYYKRSGMCSVYVWPELCFMDAYHKSS